LYCAVVSSIFLAASSFSSSATRDESCPAAPGASSRAFPGASTKQISRYSSPGHTKRYGLAPALDPSTLDFHPLGDCPVERDRLAQMAADIIVGHRQNVVGRMAGDHAKIGFDGAQGEDACPFRIDENRCRRKGFEDQSPAEILQKRMRRRDPLDVHVRGVRGVTQAVACFRCDCGKPFNAAPGLPVDPLFLEDRLEQAFMTGQSFRGAKRQDTVIIQGKREYGNDPGLRFRRQVN